MNALKAGMLATLLGLVPAMEANAVTNIAHVHVHASTTTGGNVICMGQACAEIIRTLQTPRFFETEAPPLVQDFAPISYEAFCRMLRAAKPQGCNAASPPSVPLFNSAWQGNGCGRGGLDRVIASVVVPRVFRDYSGDLDAPYLGVSFLDACNGHDMCWANGNDRGSCDSSFHDAMLDACAGNHRCRTYASAYHAAVGTNSATSTYNASLSAYHCAQWAMNIQVNGCPA